jgi:ABC-type bacteriocin/lantibiotic exporter with double-glycine peptidase domain
VYGMTQGESLPDNTIGRIIRAYNSDLSLSQMRALCARLGFDDEFSRLPLGYDTPVSFDGNTLSRSQRQMLSLARAVGSGARILALDDPVNALGDAAARRVLEGLATLPSAVVITMASESALSDLDFRVVHMGGVHPAAEEGRYGAAIASGPSPSPTLSHRA